MSWIHIERGIRAWESIEVDPRTGRKRKHRTYHIYGKHKKRQWHEKVGPDLKQAQAARRKKLMDIEERERFPERFENEIREITLKDFAPLYRDLYLKQQAPKARQQIMRRVDKIVDLLGPGTLVSDITREKAQAMIDHIAGGKGYGQHELSRNATVNRYRTRLSNMMDFAVERCYARLNPVRSIRKLKERPDKVNYLELDELKNLIEAADPRLKPMILFTAVTGMRQSETVGLRWDDVNLDAPLPNFIVWADRSKNRTSRIVPIMPETKELLECLPHDQERVFGFETFPKALWNDARKDAGLLRRSEERLKEFNWHSLRHHAASWMAMRTHDIYKIKEVLGHKSIVTTQRYAHLATESLIESVGALEDFSRGAFEAIRGEIRVKREESEKAEARKPA